MNIRHFVKSLFAVCLACVFAFSFVTVFAEENTVKNISEKEYTVSDSGEYVSYLSTCGNTYSNGKLFLDASSSLQFSGETEKGKECIAFNETGKESVWNISVQNEGLYIIKISYLYGESDGAFEDASLSFSVDGEIPYNELSSVVLPALWENETEIKNNKLGNEYQPTQVLSYVWNEEPLYDNRGIYEEPFAVFLSKGTHSFSLQSGGGKFYVSSVLLDGTAQTKPYSEIKKEYEEAGLKEYNGETITVEGEQPLMKNEKSIALKSDNTAASVLPNDPYHTKLNYIGGDCWSSCGQTIYYKVVAPKDALYKLGFHYLQSYSLGGYSYRRMKIDGEIPFSEAARIPFSYSDNWEYFYFGNDTSPYLFHLTEGEHIISFTVTMGEFTEVNRQLEDIVFTLGDNYRKIVKLTGETPDVNRDYNLFGQIAGLKDSLTDISKRLKKIVKQMQDITGSKGNSDIVVLQNMYAALDNMLAHPFQAQDYKDSYYSNYCSTGSVLYGMRNLSLAFDCFELGSPSEKFDRENDSFIKNAGFTFKRFIYSFFNDYNSVSKDTSKEALNIWLYWGRDQTQIFEKLVEESFVTQYDIPVNIKIVNSSLILAMLADDCPDLSLRVSGTDVVNLALRGALYDLSSFDDYGETLKMFSSSASEPYKFNGGCYGLPDTEAFEILFYRTDIFKELGISPPKTWDEFLYCVTVLARSNLQVGLPVPATTSAGLYPTLLLQHGGELYTEDRKSTNITSAESISAFSYLTRMFTEYGLPAAYDFYNRFRSGEMPMGIATYTMYTQLAVTAPEIDGKWSISTIPGTKTDSGINSKVTGTATGDVILKRSQHKESAWKFLKWWNSAEIQAQFSNENESVLGEVARSSPANMEALSLLSWKKDDLDTINRQWENLSELPQVPGNYYVSRSIGMAFWNVYNKHEDPKDTIIYWGNVANREIKRKLSDYGLY